MNEILLALNPIALLALFLYQHYKLKLLGTAISEQSKLITETKNVVSQQATAISSQATVVDTAIKYTQAFDPKRLEEIIRREISLEFDGEKKQLEKTISDLNLQKEEVVSKTIRLSAEKTAELTFAIFEPIVSRYVIYLLSLAPDKRDAVVAKIESDQARELIAGILTRLSNHLQSPSSAPPAA